jgi:hypothetical protein
MAKRGSVKGHGVEAQIEWRKVPAMGPMSLGISQRVFRSNRSDSVSILTGVVGRYIDKAMSERQPAEFANSPWVTDRGAARFLPEPELPW